MMSQIQTKLAQQGWSKREILAASRILARGEAHKTPTIRFFDRFVWWSVLLVALFGNFFLAAILVPFLLLMEGTSLYIALVLFGASFGALVHVLVKMVEERGKQPIIEYVFLPAVALITIYMVAYLSNQFAIALGMVRSIHEPTLVALTYSVAFMLPYLADRVLSAKRGAGFI